MLPALLRSGVLSSDKLLPDLTVPLIGAAVRAADAAMRAGAGKRRNGSEARSTGRVIRSPRRNGLVQEIGSCRMERRSPGWGDPPDRPVVVLNPFCLLTEARLVALKATVLLLLTLLVKAKIRIVAFSTLGIVLLLPQTLLVLAFSGGLALAAGGAAIDVMQQRRPAAA
jgi:hypothetical protein